jgi:DNA (cytosine-5)-methyltransferase 1
MRPRLLDLFCCQGGAGKGYDDAGFEVMGVDIDPQPRYPFEFYRADALAVLEDYARFGCPFDAIHASCPCQLDSDTFRLSDSDHPDLIAPTRELLEEIGLPYVIENVRGAVPKLRDPVMLCGAMFGLKTYRHRYFETNFPLMVPGHPPHVAPQAKMGRAPKPGEFIQCVGNFSGVEQGREAMEMPWANREGLREAIPPAYTEYIGDFLLESLNVRDAA